MLLLSNAAANAALDAIRQQIDGAVGAGKIKIYAGTMPATADAAVADNTVLAELVLAQKPAGTVADRKLTLSAINEDPEANAQGIATFFRVFDDGDRIVMQGDVTVTGKGGAMQVNSTNINPGIPVRITKGELTL